MYVHEFEFLFRFTDTCDSFTVALRAENKNNPRWVLSARRGRLASRYIAKRWPTGQNEQFNTPVTPVSRKCSAGSA